MEMGFNRKAACALELPIATELGVSLPTVRTHIQNLLCKLAVHSCLDAVVCFLRGRRVDPEPPS
jgi:hypothetical protein